MTYRIARALPLLMVLLAACTARRRVDGDVVRNIAFTGNGNVLTRPLSGQTDYQLRSQLSVHQAPFGAFTVPLSFTVRLEPFNPEALRDDAYKLEVWYANHGWFDARVEGWEIRRVRPQRRHKAGVVDVAGVLEPGPRSSVRAFEIEGLTEATKLVGAAIERTGFVHPGDDFVLPYVFDTRDLLVEELRDSSRAYATVAVDVQAYPKERVVDVSLVVDAGPVCHLGEIRIVGNEKIGLDVILDELDLHEGDAYKVSALRRGQSQLFETGLFSVVTITPDLSDPTRKVVPIEVHVSESLFRTLRYGGGFDWDGASVAPRLSTSFRHMNAFGRLWRFELRGDLGFTSRPQGGRALVASAEADLSRPRLLGTNRFGFVSKVGVRRDLQNQQFPFINPYANVTFTWKASPTVVATFGPHVEQFRFTQFEGTAKIVAETLFGEGFKNPYTLTTLDFDVVVDRRNDPFSPSRGYFGSFGARQAFPFTADEGYFYTELEVEGRKYLAVPNPDLLVSDGADPENSPSGLRRGASVVGRAMTPEVLALRGRADLLYAWDDRPLPYPERAFLGGATDLRGFRSDQVGPYTCVCLYEPASRRRWFDLDRLSDGAWDSTRRFFGADIPQNEVIEPGDPFTGQPGAGQEVDPVYLPEGGPFSGLLSAEVRYRGLGGLPVDGVVFGDAGVLASRPADIVDPSRWRVGYGFGIRYASPVGPIRLDSSFRPLYPEDWGPKGEYVGCQVDDRLPRSFDLLSGPNDARDLALRNTPFAWNVFLGIGEAF